MKRYIHANTMEWKDVLEQLEYECEDCDPLYEGTKAGEYINRLCGEVFKKMDIYVEPSVQAGMGGVWIYEGADDPGEVLVENYNFESFDERILDIAFNSKNEEDFKKKIEDWMTDTIKND